MSVFNSSQMGHSHIHYQNPIPARLFGHNYVLFRREVMICVSQYIDVGD